MYVSYADKIGTKIGNKHLCFLHECWVFESCKAVLWLQEQRAHQLEEKLRLLQQSKDELQSHSSSQAAIISDMQTKNASLNLENETFKHKIEHLNQVRYSKLFKLISNNEKNKATHN